MNRDERLVAALRDLWTQADPCPPDLAERALFRLELENLDIEVAAIGAELAGAGARGTELATTVIFESTSLSLTVTMSGAPRRPRRVDGWISPSAALRVRLHGAGGVLEQVADADGRFAFDAVPSGLVHFTVEPTPDAAVHLDRPVATPAVAI